MRKMITALAAFAAAFSAVSCSKAEVDIPDNVIKLNITVGSLEGDETKAIKKDWEDGDKLNIWFDHNTSATPDLICTFDGVVWTAGVLDNGRKLNAAGTMSVVYEAGNDWSNYDVDDRTTGSFATNPYFYFTRPRYSYYMNAAVNNIAYSYDGETLNADIHGWFLGVYHQVVVTGLGGNPEDYQLCCDKFTAPGGISVYGERGDSASGTIGFSGTASGVYVGGVPNADGVAFNFRLLDNASVGVADDYTFTLKQGSTDKVFKAVGKTLYRSSRNVNGIKIASGKFVDPESDHESVDLGLSVKWATMNVGASSPEDYGCYYQWAGTDDVASISIDLKWSNCPYHSKSTAMDTGWKKYVQSSKASYWNGTGEPDDKTILDLDDDAAHVLWSGDWRMPTKAEWAELRDNCVWTWTDDYCGTGKSGAIATSSKAGYTDRSVFFPAGGFRYSTYLNMAGEYCDYWSSSLDSTPNDAYSVNISEEHGLLVGFSYRYRGYTVRAVTK